MNGTLLQSDDEVTAVVTAETPFGILVEAGGVPGLVRGVRAAAGSTVHLRVVEVDRIESRFSAVVI